MWSGMTVMWACAFFTFNYQYLLGLITIVFFYSCQYFYGGLEMVLASQAKQPALGHIFGAEIGVKKVA
jgi:hypothetical protein